MAFLGKIYSLLRHRRSELHHNTVFLKWYVIDCCRREVRTLEIRRFIDDRLYVLG